MKYKRTYQQMRSAVYQKAHLPGLEPGTKRFEVQFLLGSNINNLDYHFDMVAAAGPPRILLNYGAISGKTRRSREAYNYLRPHSALGFHPPAPQA